MRVILQRVAKAKVEIEGKLYNSIEKGYLVLLGIETHDTLEDAIWLARKITALRVFDDANGLMNLSIHDIKGDVLIISQFTLFAKTKKGNRPSFINAANPDVAIPLYEDFIDQMHASIAGKVKSGKFGANMQVSLVNDGPVTIFMDSKSRE